jgi:hypothetical protein
MDRHWPGRWRIWPGSYNAHCLGINQDIGETGVLQHQPQRTANRHATANRRAADLPQPGINPANRHLGLAAEHDKRRIKPLGWDIESLVLGG